jgi:hypothetical protein
MLYYYVWSYALAESWEKQPTIPSGLASGVAGLHTFLVFSFHIVPQLRELEALNYRIYRSLISYRKFESNGILLSTCSLPN